MSKCVRCGNRDPAYFYRGHKGIYCRKCIGFSRILLEEEMESPEYEVGRDIEGYRFDYELTPHQKLASRKCADCIEHKNVLLYSVCGAGKTEIVVESISRFLSRGKKVAYAIARREVVKELGTRFQKIFPSARVIAVYGGHHDIIYGDLIVCTCHQLYRYHQTFDLLVIDEVDAFPLQGNHTLMNIAMNSCKGHVIFSTATLDDSLRRMLSRINYSLVELYVRPSYKPLAVPKIIRIGKVTMFIMLFILLKRSRRQSIVFVSSRKDCILLYRAMSLFHSCTYVYSDLEERDRNIEAFRRGEYRHIIATSVLERGITVRNIDVIVVSTSQIFKESNYVQMLGRIGRGIGNDEGEAYILCTRKDREIRNTLSYLYKANSHLEDASIATAG